MKNIYNYPYLSWNNESNNFNYYNLSNINNYDSIINDELNNKYIIYLDDISENKIKNIILDCYNDVINTKYKNLDIYFFLNNKIDTKNIETLDFINNLKTFETLKESNLQSISQLCINIHIINYYNNFDMILNNIKFKFKCMIYISIFNTFINICDKIKIYTNNLFKFFIKVLCDHYKKKIIFFIITIIILKFQFIYSNIYYKTQN